MQRQKQIFSLLAILGLLLGSLASAWTLPVYAGGPPAIIYVDATATGANSGLSWEDALTDIQAAITMAVSGVEIWVAEGTYTPGATRGSTFQLKNGVEMYGGFPWGGGDGSFEARDPWAHPTTLSGEIGDPSSRADNCYHVVTGSGTDGTTILDGFVVTGGYADDALSYSSGGGMYNNAGSPLVQNVVFRGNYAGNYGGGMENVAASSPLIVNVKFEGNVADTYDGGGLDNFSGSAPTLINVLFSSNYAQRNGGGLANQSSSPGIANATFVGNQAGNSGGGIYNNNSCSPVLDNTILWGNTPEQMYNLPSATPTINYGLVQDGCPAGATCDANLLAGDPLFMRTPDPGDDSVWGTDDDDYGDLRLQAGSPAIDSGSNLLYPAGYATDLPGNPRTWDGPGGTAAHQPQVITFIDRGVYENPAGRLYVDKTAMGFDTGDSWANALTDLQPALKWGRSGPTEIWVAEGLFTPGTGRTDTFQLLNGVALYGGFPQGGGDGTFNARDWEIYKTVLSGVIGISGQTDNVFHVVTTSVADDSSVLDGFTITGGCADGIHTMLHQSSVIDSSIASDDCLIFSGWGGGLCNDGGSPTLQNLIFTENFGKRGGGLYTSKSYLALENITFANNSAWEGGGLYIYSGMPHLTEVIFLNNDADYGGAANCRGDPLLIAGGSFWGNTASYGGGIYNEGGLILNNVVFSGNSASIYGGAIRNVNATMALTNGTLSGNGAAGEGGGMHNKSTYVEICNTILWGNSAPTGPQIYNTESSGSILFSLFQGGCPSGIDFVCYQLLNSDPDFIRPPDPGVDGEWGTTDDDYGNLSLQLSSPAIDSGNNELVPYFITADLDGNPRFIDVESVTDTGRGTAPIVDMGAYEAQLSTYQIYLPLVLRNG